MCFFAFSIHQFFASIHSGNGARNEYLKIETKQKHTNEKTHTKITIIITRKRRRLPHNILCIPTRKYLSLFLSISMYEFMHCEVRYVYIFRNHNEILFLLFYFLNIFFAATQTFFFFCSCVSLCRIDATCS